MRTEGNKRKTVEEERESMLRKTVQYLKTLARAEAKKESEETQDVRVLHFTMLCRRPPRHRFGTRELGARAARDPCRGSREVPLGFGKGPRLVRLERRVMK